MTKDELIRSLAEALYNAVRTDWDQTPHHNAEDELIKQAEFYLGIRFEDESDEELRARILNALHPQFEVWREMVQHSGGQVLDKICKQYGLQRFKKTE